MAFGDKVEIGKVRKASMGFEEDHGFFVITIDFDFGGSGQSYGPMCMAVHTDTIERVDHWTDEVLGRSFKKILELHEFLGVSEIAQAKGMYLEVERDSEGLGGYIQKLRRLECDGGAEFTTKDL